MTKEEYNELVELEKETRDLSDEIYYALQCDDYDDYKKLCKKSLSVLSNVNQDLGYFGGKYKEEIEK